MRKLLILLALFANPALASSPIAEVICADKSRLENRLTRQMGASRHSIGIRSPEQIMEIWTDKKGDWTLVIAYASGQSCIVAMGEDWQGLTPDPA